MVVSILFFLLFFFLALCGVKWIGNVARRPCVVKDRKCDKAVQAADLMAQNVELALSQRTKNR